MYLTKRESHSCKYKCSSVTERSLKLNRKCHFISISLNLFSAPEKWIDFLGNNNVTLNAFLAARVLANSTQCSDSSLVFCDRNISNR